MDYDALNKNGIGKISRDTVNFCSSAQQNPERNKQQQRKRILIPKAFIMNQIRISAYKKKYKNRGKHQKVKQDDNQLKVSGISNSLHILLLSE